MPCARNLTLLVFPPARSKRKFMYGKASFFHGSNTFGLIASIRSSNCRRLGGSASCLMEVSHRPLYLIIAISALVPLSFSTQGADTGQEPEKSGIEPPCFEVSNDDTAMQRAVAERQKTVEEFIAALQHPGASQQDFAIKMPFIQNGQPAYTTSSGIVSP